MINGHAINGAQINGSGEVLTPVARGHAAPWHEPTAALHAAPWRDTIARGHAAPWRVTAPVARQHRAVFDLALYNPVSGSSEIPARFGVGGATAVAYHLLAPVARWHRAAFAVEQYNPVAGVLDVPARFGARGAADVVYHLRAAVMGANDIPAPLRDTAAGTLEVAYHLAAGEKLAGTTTVAYSLVDETPLLATGEAYLLKAGQSIDAGDTLEVALDEGNHYWQASVDLASAGDAAAFRFGDAVTLHFYGVDFALVVDSVQIDRPGGADTRASLKLVSPSAMLGKPPAKPITQVWDAPVSARSVVEGLLGPVEWRIIDWTIPANRLGAENAYQMDVAKRVAAAAGAVIEPYPDGSLYVRYRFEVPLGQWGVATPDHSFSEAENVFSHADSNQYFEIRDQFRLTDIADAAFGDRIEFVPNEDNGLAGALHVYPSPWRAVTLRHTGPQAVTLTGGGDATLVKEQQIEIIEGKGNLQYPIQSITGVLWEVVDLGGLSFEPGSTTVVSSTPGESLCTVTYTTRAKVYNTASPVEDVVQFVLYDGTD